MKYNLVLTILVLSVAFPGALSIAADKPPPTVAAPWDNLSSTNMPTVITSDTMTLRSTDKFFIYEGNVVLEKGDFRMTSKKLQGRYNDTQGIDEMEAHEEVVITKGPTVRARSNKAIYDKRTETMILTENPEVTQETSLLTADLVKIFLHENRSTAEGNVRVKLIQKNEPGK